MRSEFKLLVSGHTGQKVVELEFECRSNSELLVTIPYSLSKGAQKAAG